MVELFQRGVSDASADEDKSLAEAVAEVRRLMEESGFSADQLPDRLIEASILAIRRIQSSPHAEEERELYGLGPDEATDEETKTA